MLSVSPLLQCGGRTDGDLLCPKHSPGTGESGGDSGCLPDRQEPAAAEATHGPDTGMLPAFVHTTAPSVALLCQGYFRAEALPRGLVWLSAACVAADPPFPRMPQTDKTWEAVEAVGG